VRIDALMCVGDRCSLCLHVCHCQAIQVRD
jgi:hypothetical protein